MLRGKVYLLNTCSTCKRILKQVSNFGKFEVVDVKQNKLSSEEIDVLANKVGGYEAIFNKQSLKYRSEGLKHQNLQEEDYKSLLAQEYTFLKRPVFLIDDKVFVGNSKATIEMLTNYLSMASK